MNYALISILSYNLKINFTYQTEQYIEIGDIVFIELKKKKIWGIIIEIVPFPKHFLVKTILDILYLEKSYKLFIRKLALYYIISEHIIYKKIINQLLYQLKKETFIDIHPIKKNILLLNQEQQSILNTLLYLFSQKIKKPCLLHGITGSGKTYIYIALIQYYLNINKSIICLFPNANLAHTILQEIKLYIEHKFCYEYHSHASKESRKNVWQAIIEKKAILICGVQLPIFLPITNLGCIIIDEEHDSGYAENRFPYINIKEAALLRAQEENISILLSSATPSINSIFQTQEKKYDYLKIKCRYFETKLPNVSIITMNKKEQKYGISAELENEIRDTLEKKEQVLLFLNKKGLYRYAQCKKCEYKFCCLHCSILLTVFSHHIAECNRCKYKIILPNTCPMCKKKNEIQTVGYGLGKLTQYLEALFSSANIITLDGDILKNKKNAKKIIEDIDNKNYDIILGTQVITKGYNFNAVSLVGIINADQNFCIPHFMMMEENMQQYIQVAGRAGRKDTVGNVILQTFSDINYLADYIKENNYLDFVKFELSFRKSLLLPPYIKMSLILIKSDSEESAENITHQIYKKIVEKNNTLLEKKILFISYPEKTLLYKIKNKYYYQIIVKSISYSYITAAIKNTIHSYSNQKNTIHYIPNPILTQYE